MTDEIRAEIPPTCTIRQAEPVFTITLEGQEFRDFRVESRWEGFAKYARQSDFVSASAQDWIIVSEVPNPLLRNVLNLIGEVFRTDQAGVVAISPHLYRTLTDLKAKAAAAQ